ncbi:MAG: hypothetical protein IPJ20_25915 [Flammeovirgaceae bacterium]|nr:hypothetical protein [Flammeovirgaceae bacterium]
MKGGEKVSVPLYFSSMTSVDYGKQLRLSFQLKHTNAIGETSIITMGSKLIDYQPYLQKELEALTVEMPTVAGLSILTLQMEDLNGKVLHHNFVHFEVISETSLPKTKILSVAPADFTKATWSAKQWNVLDGFKVNGAGSGFFEYSIAIDKSTNFNSIKEAFILLGTFGQRIILERPDKKEETDVDFMLGWQSLTQRQSQRLPDDRWKRCFHLK